MGEAKLKMCPFCGGEAEILSFREGRAYTADYLVRCASCFAETDVWGSEEDTIEAWNKRVGENNE